MAGTWLRVGLTASFPLVMAALYAHMPVPLPPLTSQADRVVVNKSERLMLLYSNGKVLREYAVSLGRNSDGPKEREGDNKTPEGQYILDSRHSEDSHYHLSIHISYPNARDRQQAKSLGVEPGGAISIHGLRNDLWFFGRLHTLINWTRGCIAVTNQEMEELWQVIPPNTTIDILP